MESGSESSSSSCSIIATATATPTATTTTKRKKRRVAGCVPLSADRTRCLLISSRHYPNHLVFPKGGIKHGEDAREAAARETWEECGAVGKVGDEIHVEKVGEDAGFELVDADALRKRSTVTWFEMTVDRLHDDYPERGQRLRQWYFVKEARKLDNLRPGTKLLLEAVHNRAVEASIQTAYGVVGLARADPRVLKLDSETRSGDTTGGATMYFEVPDDAADVVKRSLSVEGAEFSCSPLLVHLIE